MKNNVAKVPTNLQVAASIVKRIGVLAALAGSMSACTGIGARAEIYRIDERQESTSSKQVPLKCLFVNCDNRMEK